MTDVQVEAKEQASEGEVVKSFTIPLKGGAGHVTLEDMDAIPIEMYRYVIQMGLETIVNSAGGMPKLLKGITKLSEAEQTKAKAAVRKQAKENLDELTKGTLKQKGSRGAVKVAGAVEKEALRLAKEMVKDLLRENGIKISAYKASEHTSMAKELLKDNPDLYAKAEVSLKEREEGAKTTAPIDLKKLFGAKGEDPANKAKPKGENLKKANEAKAKAAGEKVSPAGTRAKPKAGDKPKVTPRQEAKPQQHVTH